MRRRAEGTRIPNQFKGLQEVVDELVSFEVAGPKEGVSNSACKDNLDNSSEEDLAGDSEQILGKGSAWNSKQDSCASLESEEEENPGEDPVVDFAEAESA